MSRRPVRSRMAGSMAATLSWSVRSVTIGTASAPSSRQSFVELVGGAVDEGDLRAGREHGAGAFQSNARRGAGDRRNLPGEILGHSFLFDRPSAARGLAGSPAALRRGDRVFGLTIRRLGPCDMRERRARESAMTATAGTPPVILYRSGKGRSSRVLRLAVEGRFHCAARQRASGTEAASPGWSSARGAPLQ